MFSFCSIFANPKGRVKNSGRSWFWKLDDSSRHAIPPGAHDKRKQVQRLLKMTGALVSITTAAWFRAAFCLLHGSNLRRVVSGCDCHGAPRAFNMTANMGSTDWPPWRKARHGTPDRDDPSPDAG
jgi:hypothetical protein